MSETKLNINKITEKMAVSGLSQTDLAKKLDVSKEAVSQWIKGKKFPRPAKLLSLAKILQLGFDDIIIQHAENVPVVAYRTNKNKKLTPEVEAIAKDMGVMLKVLLPYLDGDSVFSPPLITNPKCDDLFIQKAAGEVKRRIGNDKAELSFSDIMRLYNDFRIIFIPVMWGPNGDNGLYIHLPDNSITFVYANLEKVVTDFKFWLLHELAHALTPDLTGDDAECFADGFAAAMLFPEGMAEKYYNEICKIKNTGTVINTIKTLASKLIISPFTILNEMNRFAKMNSLRQLNIDIGGAVTNFNKQVNMVSEIIFEEGNPDAEKYIAICKNEFNTPFFDVLQKYIIKEKKEAGFVQRLLNIPIADAKGVHIALAK